jgi:hypothetical protein
MRCFCSTGHTQGRPEAAFTGIRPPAHSSGRQLAPTTNVLVMSRLFYVTSTYDDLRVRRAPGPTCQILMAVPASRPISPPVLHHTRATLLFPRPSLKIHDQPSAKGQIVMCTTVVARGSWLVPPSVEMVTLCFRVMCLDV